MGFISDLFGGGSGANFKAKGFTQADNDEALNQSNIALQTQKNLVNNIQASQPNVYGQQQQLSDQLMQQAQGQGPNPAQAMLAQQTAANTANQAALAANQRGASANAGLIQRQAMQQGATNQQHSIGQAATLGAQQQLAAQQQLGQQQAQMAGQQQQAISGQGQLAQGALNTVSGSVNNQNSVNAEIQKGNQKSQGNIFGSLLGAAGSIVGTIYGGPVGGAAGGALGKGLGGALDGGDANSAGESINSDAANTAAHGGEIGKVGHHKVPGPKSNIGNRLKAGGQVPGQASAKGDSYANDTVQARLSPGEVVIPRSIMNGPNAGEKARKFVEAILAKKGLK